MEGKPCPRCGIYSEWLSTINEWEFNCPEHGRFNNKNQFLVPGIIMITKTQELSKDIHTLILTVGLPYSGKSTWARSTGFPIVCPDSIRVALHGQRFSISAEEFVWAITRVMIKSLFLSGHSKVILDATNITQERRSRWLSSEWLTSFIMFGADVDTCINRAKVNGDEEIIPIIERMASERELPIED